MMENNQVSPQDDPSTAFIGVRFVLRGFDAIREEQIRLKLVEGGGVDAVDYGPGCTHVIVDKIVYDDPICVNARRDGKIVVTGLWVDDSFDAGAAIDTNTLIYRPVRDFNGIPGAKSMVACLTGYQRPDRDDIMTMVGLMGARFSKPLVANKVTHLICYKFEGEKYELAKKMKSIKLVNHRWLEDCFKAWELLPETEYSKSGYEVDMEAEAKDSEDETENVVSIMGAGRNIAVSPQARNENNLSHKLPMKQEMSRNTSYSSASKSLVNHGNSHKVQSTPRKDSNVENASLTGDSYMPLEIPSDRSSPKVSSAVPPSHIHEMPEISKKSPSTDVSKQSSKNNFKSPPGISVDSGRTEGVTCRRSVSTMKQYSDSGVSVFPLEAHQYGADFHEVAKTPLKETDLQLDKAETGSVPAKKKMTLSHGTSRSRKMSPGSKFPLERHQDGADFHEEAKTPVKETDLQLDEAETGSVSAKRKMTLSHGNSRSRRMSPGSKFPRETHQEGADFHDEAKTPLKETDLQLDEAEMGSVSAKRKMTLSYGNSRSRRMSPGSKFPLEMHQDGADFHEIPKTPLEETDLQLDGAQAASFSAKRKMSLSHGNSRLQRESPGSKLPLATHQDGGDFHEVVKAPLTETNLQIDEAHTASLSAKRKINLAHGNSKSRRVSPGFKSPVESKSAAKTTDMLASEFSFDGSRESAGRTPPSTEQHCLTDVASKDRQECSEGVLKNYQSGSKNQKLSDHVEIEDHSLIRNDNVSHEVEMGQSNKQNMEPLFLNSNVTSGEKSDEQDDFSLSKSGKPGPQPRRMTLSKKTLGSRPGTGKGRIANTKGSIGLKKATVQNDYVAHPDVSVITSENNCVSIANEVTMASTDGIKASNNQLHESHCEATNEDRLLDEDTEAPDDEAENQHVAAINAESEASDIRSISSDKRVGLKDIGKHSTHNINAAKLKMANPAKDSNVSEDENSVPGKNTVLTASKSAVDAKKKASPKLKKRPAKTKRTVSGCTKEYETEDNKAVDHNEETVQLVGKAKGRPAKKLKSSTYAEKENKPVGAANQSLSSATGAAEKTSSKTPKKTMNKSLNSDLGISGSVRKAHDHETKDEPACFILCGHRLQRKEFQQVIKRLKGKVCRDSHNWSYQATHFIVPDPIRRTEKFFAAAACGSWILKMDYLTASNEAGKFLSEEPYEWHKKGLSEDGAINLEAPRKWRLLRERTGHCAFHGMRIVIYGECIAPPLDTLKRVIKAGEGTILATSPPYSRFFQSGIDFAIVSPGMPRVDMWVQEFLRHQVPCISADYLVEYVCKPGYSLERHVQYNTHAWAEKSLKNLVSRVEEVDDEPKTPEDQGTDDVACLVCESPERGDEMLICGDESGNLGCGAGMHLDCHDPPLQNVPEEDWFCPSCSKKEENKSSGQRKSKKSTRSKK